MAKKRRGPQRGGPPRRQADKPRRPAFGGRPFLLLLLAGSLLGVGGGALLGALFPPASFRMAERAGALLHSGTVDDLQGVTALCDDDTQQAPSCALAHALLHLVHGAPPTHLQRARALLQQASSRGRLSAEGLYARVLVDQSKDRPGGDAKPDAALDVDLARVTEDAAPWALLARARRGAVVDEAMLQRAALAPGAPTRAQHELALLYASRGEAADARAVLARLLQAEPRYAPAHLTHVVVSVIEDLRDESDEERAQKLRQVRKRDGAVRKAPPRPGEPRDDEPVSDAAWRTPAEDQALAALEDDVFDAPGAHSVVNLLEALAVGRNDLRLVQKLRARAAALDPSVGSDVPRQRVTLQLLEGELEAAAATLAALSPAQQATPELATAALRLRLLRQLPEDERRRRTGAPRTLDADGVTLPFGRLRFAPSQRAAPLSPAFDPNVLPEGALHDADARGVLAARLPVIEAMKSADNALARGDLDTARTALEAAQAAAPNDPDVLLALARLRVRQGDRLAAKAAIDSAVDAASAEPRVLVAAVRMHAAAENYIPARKALQKLKATAFESPTALAVEAGLDVRTGNLERASKLLADAKASEPTNIEVLRTQLLLNRERGDVDATRRAADALLSLDGTQSPDPIARAWLGEAAFRRGDVGTAEPVLDEVLRVRPQLPEAHLFRGILYATTGARTEALAAFAEAVTRGAPKSELVIEAKQRQQQLGGAAAQKPKKARKR